MKVVATIVAWNSMHYLPDALASLARQSYADLEVVVVDNASSDGAAEFVRSKYPGIAVLRNSKNLGFARAHNQAIRYASERLRGQDEELFILVTNPDIIMADDFIARAAAALEARPDAGSACGRLAKVAFQTDGEARDVVEVGRIDSAGLRVYKSGRVADRGEGEQDVPGRFEKVEDVFGPPGALAMFRLTALLDAAHGPEEFFDDDFFAYKEDVDLAWRLRHAGNACIYVPAARAFHHRTAAGTEQAALAYGDGRARRRRRSGFVNVLAQRNHMLMLAKNLSFSDFIRYFPWIVGYEIGKLGYFLLLERGTLAAYPQALRLLPRIMAKRRAFKEKWRAQPAAMRKWFMSRRAADRADGLS